MNELGEWSEWKDFVTLQNFAKHYWESFGDYIVTNQGIGNLMSPSNN